MPYHKNKLSKDFHKTIRKLLDTSKYTEIIKSIITFIESGETILPDTISNILANVLKITTEIDDINFIISLIKEENYTELTYTSLIKIYIHKTFFDIDKVFYYYHLMKEYSIPIKRRTLCSIFSTIKDIETILYFYTDSKVQNVELVLEDYIGILHIDIPTHYKTMIIQDMANVIKSPISIKYKTIFDTLYKTIPFEPSKYFLCKKDSEKMLEKMKIYIGHFYGKNPRLLASISKSMGLFTKKKYDIVIDGANVGFFKRGTMSGKKICFSQIFELSTLLCSLGYKPIIILHMIHMEMATPIEKKLIETNRDSELFIVPKGADDDWVWLFAAISNKSSMLLTNDEMRNHFHYMNFEQEFIDWKSTKVINYDMCPDTKKFELKIPYPYLKKMEIDMRHRKLGIPYQDDSKETIWSGYSF
uniref:PRORP domain-containing protein n=1 Tax=viral metagenome TaxID=1070528 RepID=A0A6C0J7G3_9ZZZZ